MSPSSTGQQDISESLDSTDNPVNLQRDLLLARQKRRGGRRMFLLLASVPILLVLVAAIFSTTRAIEVVVFPLETLDQTVVSDRLPAVIEVIQGLGIVVEGRVYSLTDQVRIGAMAPGYFGKEVEVNSATGSYLEVRLEPKPARLTMRLSNAPSEDMKISDWLIGGEKVAQGPTIEIELPAGDHQLTVDNPYFEKAEVFLTLQRDEKHDLEVALTPVQGRLALASNPEHATILVDGHQMQIDAPVALNAGVEVSGGKYAVEVQADGYGTVKEFVQVTRAKPVVERNYRLIRDPAFLSITVLPENGRLTLNGRRIEIPKSVLNVGAAREQILLYELDGYHSETRRIQLRPGQKEDIRIDLRKHVGEVDIVSTPTAKVMIDGRSVGRTPLNLTLPAIPHQVTVSLAGHHPVSKVVVPNEAAAQRVDVELLTELDHRLANIPGRYENVAGLEMLRFRPNERIKLGAPRSEKGQRANEQIRDVALTKALYVSRTEVTTEQFARFRALSAPSALPQVNVSWIQAIQFCNWLSQQEGLEPVYQFVGGRFLGSDIARDGYRLPTEAEWEWLARKAGRREVVRFTWGDEYTLPDRVANVADEQSKALVSFFVPRYDDGFPSLAPVGSFGVDAAGLADLSGNVSEWVHDFYSIAPLETQDIAKNPSGPSQGDGHVVKGSSWRSGTATALRASYRDNAVQPRDDLGFRVARYVYGYESDETNGD